MPASVSCPHVPSLTSWVGRRKTFSPIVDRGENRNLATERAKLGRFEGDRMAERRPIETAPKDGSEVVVYWTDADGVMNESVARWRDGNWWTYIDRDRKSTRLNSSHVK